MKQHTQHRICTSLSSFIVIFCGLGRVYTQQQNTYQLVGIFIYFFCAITLRLTVSPSIELKGSSKNTPRIWFREATKSARILSRICDNQWKGEPFWLASLTSKETKPRVSPSNLSGNLSVNIGPVSSLLRLQCGSKAVCRMDGSCLAARVNTLPFCCIPGIHYTASQHTGGAVRSYQFHYPLNPLTGALTCWMRLILIWGGGWGLGAVDRLIQTTKVLETDLWKIRSHWIIHTFAIKSNFCIATIIVGLFINFH